MVMQVVKYVTEDESEFDSEQDALDYEKNYSERTSLACLLYDNVGILCYQSAEEVAEFFITNYTYAPKDEA